MNPNDPAEADTGNHRARRGARTPGSWRQPRKRENADGDGVHGPEAHAEGPRGCGPRGAAGVHEERGRWGEKRRELGRAERVRGEPQVGGFARSAEGRSAVRSTGRTRRTGEPSTRGSGGQGVAAGTGHRRRARRTGPTPANLPAGERGQGAARAAASVPPSGREAPPGGPPREVALGAEEGSQRGGAGQRAGVCAGADGEHPGPGGAAEAAAVPGDGGAAAGDSEGERPVTAPGDSRGGRHAAAAGGGAHPHGDLRAGRPAVQ